MVQPLNGATPRPRRVSLVLQIAYSFSAPLVTDKSPNSHGQKAFVVDVTGLVIDKADEWLATAASIGSHLIRLAMLQQIIDDEDLRHLKPGDSFTLAQLVQRRSRSAGAGAAEAPQRVDQMCGPIAPLSCH